MVLPSLLVLLVCVLYYNNNFHVYFITLHKLLTINTFWTRYCFHCGVSDEQFTMGKSIVVGWSNEVIPTKQLQI